MVESARQVMEEGEALSRKQLAQESTIRKLRVAAKEAAEARATVEATLASEQRRLQEALAAHAASEEHCKARCATRLFPCCEAAPRKLHAAWMARLSL